MTNFLLIPGGGGAAYVWHRVARELHGRGHTALAVDLPADDPAAGIEAYADGAAAAADHHRPGEPWTVVGMSLGAFSAPLLLSPQRLGDRAERLVLLNPMIPQPGETAGEWWGATRQGPAMVAAAEAGGYPSDFELEATFLHDIGEVDRHGLEETEREEDEVSFTEPFALTDEAWPPRVPLRVIASAEDRLFPVAFVAELARTRLGERVDLRSVPGGHLSPLSQPIAVADALLAP